MDSTTYENKILDAIETVVNNAVQNAGYDKTIQATIVSCDNPKLGKYTVKYQDITFIAYSQNTTDMYEEGALVQILVPGNDMSKEKTILGALDRDLVTITDIFEGDSGYDIIGGNVIPSPEAGDASDYGLCSYVANQSIVLYDVDNNINLLHYDNKKLESSIKDSNSLILGGYFRTYLDKEQQKAGKYGLKFTFQFKDNNAGDLILKEYIMDINQIIGNPYELNDFTRQYGIYEIQSENFIQLQKIEFFEEAFPNIALDKPNDIWVKNIEITPAKKLTDEELAGYYLSVETGNNNYFDAGKEDPIEVTAKFRISGKKINNNTAGVEYYWFKENNDITSDSADFLYYGKEGWQCLNDVLQYKDDLMTKVFQASNGIFQIQKEWTTCLDTTFKCVVVYNGEVVAEKQFQIKNYAANYTVAIKSTGNVTEYFFDNGLPNIAAQLYRLINGEWVTVGDNFCRYVWSYVDNDSNWHELNETTDLNNQYHTAANNLRIYEFDTLGSMQYNNLTQSQKEHYDALQDAYDAIKDVQRVEGKQVLNIDLTQILNKRTFKCSVWANINNEWIFVGSESYEIDNTAIIDDGYYINIINGTQTFEYDSKGGAPTSKTKTNPMTIQPLTFEIYNGRGTKLNARAIENSSIRWSLPNNLEKSMLKFENYIVDETGNYYKDVKSIAYDIENYYNIDKTENDINLEVRYKNLILNTKTNFTFVKNGQPGTNGTDFVCLVEPNLMDEDTFNDNVVFFRDGQELNYTPKISNKWFNVKLYDGSDEITSDQYSVRWSLLLSSGGFTINSDGSCAIVNNPTYTNNADIVQCQITYKSKDFYGTLPIIHATCNKTDFNKINLKKNTGFNFVMYMNDGSKPEYNKTSPFTIEINKTIDGKSIDIADVVGEDKKINEVTVNPLTYVWTPYGTRYVNRIRGSINQIDTNDNPILTIKRNSQIKNTCELIPAESIDGGCLNTGVQIDISGDQIENTTLYIPIHMYLNRFGVDSLNGWNGNSIETSNGRILAPQVGAGEKDSNNRFTGVFMGAITTQNDKDIGLMGYHQGVRSIFLDAKTGRAEFGKAGESQIILNPSNGTAKIQSGNYSTTDKTGMLIDLTTPEIKFGSGNFQVDSSGHLTAKGGGKIAGWTIGDTRLNSGSGNTYIGLDSGTSGVDYGIWLGKEAPASAPFSVTRAGALKSTSGSIAGWTIDANKFSKGKVGISSDNSADTNYAFWAGNATASSAPFSVTFGGALKATSATIEGNVKAKTGTFGNGTNKITIGTNGTNNVNSAIYSGSKSTLNSTNNGFYIGTDGIALGAYNSTNGNPFQVTTAGVLSARGATISGTLTAGAGSKIGNWTIDNGAIKYSNTVYLGSDGSVKFGNFSVNTSGNMTATGANITGTITTDNLTATNGTIGGWNLYSTELQKQVGEYTFEIRSDRGASDPALLVYKNQGSNQGYKFYVRPDGYLYATSGNISGSIVSSGISATNITAGRLNITDGNGHYLRMGFSEGKNPSVSGLNVSASGAIDFGADHGVHINGNAGEVAAASTDNSVTLTGTSGIYINGDMYIGSYKMNTDQGTCVESADIWTGDWDNVHIVVRNGLVKTLYASGRH